MVEPSGCVDGLFNVCVHCENKLKDGRLPKYAIRNQLFRGALPAYFKDITWVEEMVCSIYRCTAHVSHLYGSPDPTQPRVFYGNTCAHDVNLVSTVNVLPRTPSDIKDMLSVIFVGPRQSIKSCLKTLFYFRKKKVWNLLRYLCKHNRLYHQIELSIEQMELYGQLDSVDDI
ncbi:hypothetical protein ARMSODRAFT_899971, partial [Armillaria solidipes]